MSWSLKGVRGGFCMRMKADRPPSGELSRETSSEPAGGSMGCA